MPNIPFPQDIPFSFQDARSEFDRLLDRVWHGGLNTAPLDGQDWAPRLDVEDLSDRYLLRAEIPGVLSDQVEVSILGNVVTLKGTKKTPERSDEKARKLRSECRYGSFCRTYELPSAVQEENVTAACKDGILRIEIPKVPEVQGRTVAVSEG